MELKDIVHDIEYGIKLKELGVKQDSIFYFTHISGSEKTWIKDGAGQKLDSINYNGKENIIRLSAFTSTELLEMLPEELIYEKEYFALRINCDNGKFYVAYVQRKDKTFFLGRTWHNNIKISHALAEMLIYLIENKLISIV